jgi:farnesyl-diphosphate farnesyltransferase
VKQLIEGLQSYGDVAQGKSSELPEFSDIAALQEHEGEQRLMQHVAKVISSLEAFGGDDQNRMRKCLDIIIGGQILDLQRFGAANESDSIGALNNSQELDDYAYRVAGSVGEFWTSMTLAHQISFSQNDETKMYELGIRFGKALQMINILRDIPEDLRFGRCYIPADSLGEINLQPTDLIDPKNMEKFRPLFEKNLDIAESHLDAAAEYIAMLPYSQFRLRAACMLPVLIGQRTLSLLRTSNVLDQNNRVKVLRPEIKRLRNQTLRALVIPGGCQRLLRKNRGI